MPRGRRKIITHVQGFKIGSVVVIEKKDVFHGVKLAAVTDQCKWDEDGIVCTLFDTTFPFRDIVIFTKDGDKIRSVST